jgi:hypothetical protein
VALMPAVVEWDRLRTWNRDLALAVVFGLASAPWTYGFVAALDMPLWPAFVGSATVFAVGDHPRSFRRALSSNLVGVAYAASTLAVVAAVGGGVPVLSLTVGVFMFVASLHAFVPAVSYTPGLFSGMRRSSASTRRGRRSPDCPDSSR